jgi:uncharacterized membrane protein
MSRARREAVPLLSLLALVGSALCFAQAAVLVRRFPRLHPVVTNAVGMAAGVYVGALRSTRVPPALPQGRP